jgi:anti-sigma regulatory factor (Ser/Thr protein kinase)
LNETLKVRLDGGPEAPARARAAASALNGSLDDARDTVKLLISELVTNCVRHAGADQREVIELDVLATPEKVRVAVADHGPGFDPDSTGRKTPGEDGGFGLLLVESLADRWGVERSGPQRVWFEIDRL